MYCHLTEFKPIAGWGKEEAMPKVLSHDTLTDDFQMPHPALQFQVKLLVWVIQLPPAQIVTGRRRRTLPAAPPWLLKVLQIQNFLARRLEQKEGKVGMYALQRRML